MCDCMQDRKSIAGTTTATSVDGVVGAGDKRGVVQAEIEDQIDHSSGSAARPSGVLMLATAGGVSTGPGDTQQARTPWDAPTKARDLVMPRTPLLQAL